MTRTGGAAGLAEATSVAVAELGRLDVVVANAGVVAVGTDAPLMSTAPPPRSMAPPHRPGP